jgi:hypothetical protein
MLRHRRVFTGEVCSSLTERYAICWLTCCSHPHLPPLQALSRLSDPHSPVARPAFLTHIHVLLSLSPPSLTTSAGIEQAEWTTPKRAEEATGDAGVKVSCGPGACRGCRVRVACVKLYQGVGSAIVWLPWLLGCRGLRVANPQCGSR